MPYYHRRHARRRLIAWLLVLDVLALATLLTAAFLFPANSPVETVDTH